MFISGLNWLIPSHSSGPIIDIIISLWKTQTPQSSMCFHRTQKICYQKRSCCWLFCLWYIIYQGFVKLQPINWIQTAIFLCSPWAKNSFHFLKLFLKNSRVILHNMPKSFMKLKFHCPYIQSYWNSAILIDLHSAIHWGRCYRHKDEKENTISGLPAFSSHNTFPSLWPIESI